MRASTITFSLFVALLMPSGTAMAEDLGPPPAAPSEVAESIAPPPPQSDPIAPALLTKRIRLQYSGFIYPAYLAWLGSANGLPNSAMTFGFYLSLQGLDQFQRYCFMRCYLEAHD